MESFSDRPAGDVGGSDNEATRNNAALGGLEKIALEIVKDSDKIPGIGLNHIFVLFEIGDAGVDRGIARFEKVDGDAGAIDGRHLPASRGEPLGVAAGSASEIESAAGRKFADTSIAYSLGEERSDTLLPKFSALQCAIAFIPAAQVHNSSIRA